MDRKVICIFNSHNIALCNTNYIARYVALVTTHIAALVTTLISAHIAALVRTHPVTGWRK